MPKTAGLRHFPFSLSLRGGLRVSSILATEKRLALSVVDDTPRRNWAEAPMHREGACGIFDQAA